MNVVPHTTTKTNIIGAGIVIAIIVLSMFMGVYSKPVVANSASDLRNQISNLEDQIKDNESEAARLHGVAESLEQAIAEIDNAIKALEEEIKLTELKIEEITLRLEETRKELDRQKKILSESIREHYKLGDVTTIELFAASDNFSDFFNQKEYLDRLRASIHESSLEVARLEDELVKQQTEQKNLLSQLEGQKQDQEDIRKEKDELLEQTRGEEANYRALVAKKEAQQAKAQAALEALLASDSYVSLGYINQGQTLGYVGSTGNSTGPHLHFALYNANKPYDTFKKFEDPQNADGSLKNGMIWPIQSSWRMSTDYGYIHCSNYTGCGPGKATYYPHAGIDMAAPLKTPVVAAQSGNIVFRGWQSGWGYIVIVDHGNGYKTFYPHMCDGNNCYGG